MVEREYDFLMPSVNFFGPGVISKIGERAKMLGMKKPVIVTDKFLENLKNSAVAQTLASLKKSGVDYVVYNGVEPNPKIHNIKEVKTLYEKEDADSIITVGGGSAHDTGKRGWYHHDEWRRHYKIGRHRDAEKSAASVDCC